MKKRVVVALGGNALGNSLPEQKIAVKSTAKTIIDLVEADCDVVVKQAWWRLHNAKAKTAGV